MLYPHHQTALEKFITTFSQKDEVQAILVGGSLVKGFGKPGSDLDVMIIIDEDSYAKRKASGELSYYSTDFTDYEGGYVDGKHIGIAIFDHPKNPSHPTWWHVRDYGLFAANPFGKHDFEKLKDHPNAGDITIPAGGELTLRYRIFFHEGDEQSARVAQHYADYAAAAAR